MHATSFFILTAALLLLACSGERSEPEARQADDALIAPVGLPVTAHASGCGALKLLALTLHPESASLQLYAALKNEGDEPACSPAFSVSLLDKSAQSLAMGVGGLLVQRFYQLADGSGTMAACVAPGDVTMIALTDLTAEVALEDVGGVEYWCNFWTLDVVPIEGFSISEVQPVSQATGVSYTGALANGFDTVVTKPSVAVFPLNRAGRPLGMALGRGLAELPPGGSWSFETSTVSEPGVAQAAYPAGGP